TCAISGDAELYCWGNGENGRLGVALDDTDDRLIPTRVGIATNWTQVTGISHTCAINTDGELYCWGIGDNNVLGLGPDDTDGRTTPTQIINPVINWMQISGDFRHTCAIDSIRDLYCWGAGLGLGASTNRPIPTLVSDATNWEQVNVGSSHTCAINTIGELYCLGFGINGSLGLGALASTSTPTRVGTAINWVQVSAGTIHTCAINTTGELYCWGNGGSGRLGLGDVDHRNTPTRVGTAINWAQVSAGGNHTCAINTTGELYCWGTGGLGQLGINKTIDRNTPTRVGTAINWARVSAGGSHTCAVNATGQLHCWGNNVNGQLGLNSNTSKLLPQVVTTARTPTTAPVLANLIVSGSEAPARFNNGMFGAGDIIPALVYTNNGGDVQPDGCVIDTTNSRPALPAGLRAHPIVSGSNVTCQISGIPTEAATMAIYHLTATNAIGSSDAVTVSFQVVLVRPILADIATEQSYAMGIAITPQTFTNTGLAVKATDGCAVSPALPAGLALAAFDDAGTMTCQITG
ncbi:MAG: hypothetical protein K8963_09135, partial [Proteobacteria bacterium]|nr:hypothetical protein [Pseudomonadota bacterium]